MLGVIIASGQGPAASTKISISIVAMTMEMEIIVATAASKVIVERLTAGVCQAPF